MGTGDSVPGVEDIELVAAIRGGDQEAFGQLYDRYADRLFAYAVGLVRDRDTATDVVHDAFLVAHERIGQLRDPSRLRSWMYAIVRSEALRVLRQGRRLTDLDAAGDVMDETTDLDADLEANEARSLVVAALAGLGEKDREVIELALRHELDNAEISSALGVSSSHASAVVSRAKGQFEKSLGAVVLIRTRGRDCPELAALIGGEGEPLTPLLRKRVSRHVAECETCERSRRGAVAAMPGVAMALPFLAAPASLRERLVSSTSTPNAADVAERAGRFDRDGFPRAVGARRRRAVLVAGITAALLVVGGVGAVAIGGDGGEPTPTAAVVPLDVLSIAPSATPTTAPAAPSATGTTSASTTPSTSPSATASSSASAGATARPTGAPTRTKKPTKRPTATPTAPAPAAAVAFSWTDLDEGSCPATFSGQVTATVTGAPVSSVVAIWAPINGGSGTGGQTTLTKQGQVWKGTVAGVPTQQENVVRVRATTTKGVVTTTTTRDFSHICPQ